MVGQKNRLKLADISAQLVGKSFAAGWEEYERGDGLDCFTLVIEYLRLRGKEITGEDKFKGHKVKDYILLYEESKVKAIGLAIGLLRSFMKEVKKNFINPGDVLIIKNKKVNSDIIHFGIECANNRAIVAIVGSNIQVIDKKYFTTLGAFTWV
jgi:hypothetical protein